MEQMPRFPLKLLSPQLVPHTPQDMKLVQQVSELRHYVGLGKIVECSNYRGLLVSHNRLWEATSFLVKHQEE